jgi:hypothetical protein
MSKKEFVGGLGSLLGEAKQPTKAANPKKIGRPKTQLKEITKSSQEGTKENETRATFIVKEDLLEKLKALAYWERKLIKDVIGAALQEAVDKYEKKNGIIKQLKK